jgi:hypothetical protein
MTQVNDFVVTGGATFKGTSGLIENAQTTNVTSGTGAGTTTLTKSYYSFGATESKTYGVINTSTVMGFAITATISVNPATPWPTNPTLNTPYTNTSTLVTETSAGNFSASQTETRTFSTEQITTLAGTFAACKVKSDVTANGATTTSYSWTVGSGRLKGHLLKSTTAAGVRTLEVTALQVNGS